MNGVGTHTAGTTGHPGNEALAALIDGRLSPDECRSVREHLARCEDCYEVFVETARWEEEQEAQESDDEQEDGEEDDDVISSPSGTVRFFPSPGPRTPAWRWTYAAAAALLVTGSVALYRAQLATQRTTVEHLAAMIESSPEVANRESAFATFRGAEDEVGRFDGDAFQIGALLVDARLGFANPERTSETLRRIALILKNQGTLADEERVFFEQAAAEQPVQESTRKRLAKMEESLEELYGPVHFGLGKWAGAAWAAAQSGQPAFFEERTNRRFLSYVLRDDEALAPEVRASLLKVQEDCTAGAAENLDSIKKELSNIFAFYQWEVGAS